MENTINIDLLKRFLKDFWPKYRSQLYKDLYNTYHPSAYAESFNRPASNFEDALETVADAVHEGKKLGLLDSSVDWSDVYNYDALDLEYDGDTEYTHSGIDDSGIPTLNNQLEIIDNTNLDWIHGILLFDVLEEIVDEFKHYCGENGVDESGMGKCMDEFPPLPNIGNISPRGGTLKQDYYTLYNFMKELERAGIPVTDYLKNPTYPNIIKLVDDGSTDYDTTGGYFPNRQDSEAIDTEKVYKSFGIEPDRIEEQEQTPKQEPTQTTFQKTLKDMGVQLQFVGTFGFGISGMFGMVKDLLEGRYPSLSEGEIILIFLSALSYLSIDIVKDISELKSELKKRGLGDYLNKTVEVLKDFENISLKIVEKAGFTVSSLAELLGYTFLLVPILDITNKLIAESGFDIVSLSSYLKAAIVSVGIFYVRNLFNSLVLRLRKLRENKNIYGTDLEDDLEDDLDDEMIEEGVWVGKVLSKRFNGSRVITDERIGKLSLIDESKSNKNLKWLVEQENKINWLNSKLTKSLEKIEIKNLNDYQSILELNIINNRLINESKLHEGVYMAKIAEKATTDVVKEIFDVVKIFEGGEEMFILPDYYSDVDGDEYEYGELKFNVEVTIIENENEEDFKIDAFMGGEFNDTIYVEMTLSPNFNEKYYESLYIVLTEYVRHEIEHILQDIDPDRPDLPEEDLKQKSLNLTPFEYYSQDYELDAQKVGFERRAKMEDKSVGDVISDYLEYRQHIDKLSDGEKQELISRLTT
tara:strand:- start:3487 stop:5745 length:2259 start_codon:yes stop_codon:yes gene_type:complete